MSVRVPSKGSVPSPFESTPSRRIFLLFVPNGNEKSALCPTDIKPSLNNQVTSGALLDHVNVTCKPEGGKEVYAFSYTGFGGVVCAIVMTIIIIGFTLDIAVRAIKLAILRLIAPVPIISYISPGQEKDGAFGNKKKDY